jgi:L-serine dehydratase
MGVSNAIISAEFALATGGRTLVPFDEVITVMYNVGRSIPYQLRETALGGLAATPSVKNLKPGCAACGACK